MKTFSASRRVLVGIGLCILVVLGGAATGAVQNICGPFTDVSSVFCPYVLEMYYLGVTAGTSATTFSPDTPMTRGQAAVFVSKGLNQALARSSRRAALGQWWTPDSNSLALSAITVGDSPGLACDGTDLWVSPLGGGFLERYRASDGRYIETWNVPGGAGSKIAAMGRIFVLGPPATLYMIDPSQPAGTASVAATNLGNNPSAIAFDGSRLWTTNTFGSVSIVTPTASPPWPVTTVTAGFTFTNGILFDGSNIWITDQGPGALMRLDNNGAIVQTIPIGRLPGQPVFDGQNIWVPDTASASVTVVSAATGGIVAVLSGNGMYGPWAAAFDGKRVLVTNIDGNSVSLWQAADLTPVGFVTTGSNSSPADACSDGVNFWIALSGTGQIARF